MVNIEPKKASPLLHRSAVSDAALALPPFDVVLSLSSIAFSKLNYACYK